jgi:hypothetical protein
MAPSFWLAGHAMTAPGVAACAGTSAEARGRSFRDRAALLNIARVLYNRVPAGPELTGLDPERLFLGAG